MFFLFWYGTRSSSNFTTLIETIPFRRVTSVGSLTPPRKADLENLPAFCMGKQTQSYELSPAQGGILMEFNPPLYKLTQPRGNQGSCCFSGMAAAVQQRAQAQIETKKREFYSALEGLSEDTVNHFNEVLQSNPLFISSNQRVPSEKMAIED